MFPTEKSTFFGGLAEPGCLFPPTSPPVSQIYDNFHPGNSCIPKKFLYTKCCTWSRDANEILFNFFDLLYSMASEQPCVPLTWILFWPQMWEIFLFGKINFYAYCSILKPIMDGCLLWTVCLFVFVFSLPFYLQADWDLRGPVGNLSRLGREVVWMKLELASLR